MRDIKSTLEQFQSLTPAARTASANGSSANLQGYNAAMALVSFGVITDGTHTPKLQESSDNSTFTDVAATDLNGAFVVGVASSVQRVGYIGALQYVRVVMTISGATTGAVSSAEILAGFPAQSPTA